MIYTNSLLHAYTQCISSAYAEQIEFMHRQLRVPAFLSVGFWKSC